MLATDNVHTFMRPGPQERQISLELPLCMNFLVWRPPWSTTSTHQGSVFFTGRVKWEGRGAARVIWDLISSTTLSKNDKLLKTYCESSCNTAGRVCFFQIGWWGGGVGFFVLWTGRVLCLNNRNPTFCLYHLQVRHRMFAWKRKSKRKLTLLCLLEFVVNVSSIPWLKEKKKSKGKGKSLINTETQLPGHFSLLNTKSLFF